MNILEQIASEKDGAYNMSAKMATLLHQIVRHPIPIAETGTVVQTTLPALWRRVFIEIRNVDGVRSWVATRKGEEAYRRQRTANVFRSEATVNNPFSTVIASLVGADEPSGLHVVVRRKRKAA